MVVVTLKKYALLFAGCVDESNWYKRYENDLGFMYETLQKNNYDIIEVLYYDGSPIYYNNQKIPTQIASKSNFFNVLRKYSKLLKEEDQIIIFVSNHGGEKNSITLDSHINCYGYENISRYEFTNIMNLLNSLKIIILGQCYGGDFIDLPISKSVIMSANEAGKVSYASLQCECEYDEFLYHLTAYFNGSYPNKPLNDVLPNLTNKIIDGFKYARDNDMYKIPYNIWDSKTNQNVVFFESPQIAINLEDFDNICF